MKVHIITLMILNLVLIFIIAIQSLEYSYRINNGFMNPLDIFNTKYTIVEMLNNISNTLVLYENYTFYIYVFYFLITFVFFILYLNHHKHGILTKQHYIVEKQNVILTIIIYSIIIIYNNVFKGKLLGKIAEAKGNELFKEYGLSIIAPFSIVFYLLMITTFLNNNLKYLKWISENITEFINIYFPFDWIITRS